MNNNSYTNRTGTLDIPSTVITLTASLFTSVNNFSAITSGSTNYPASDNVLYDIKTTGLVQAIVNARLYSGTLTFRNDTTNIVSGFMYDCTARTGALTLPASIKTTANSIAANAFTGSTVANRPQFTQCNSYNTTQPGAAINAFAFQSAGAPVAIPLHVPTGSSSYTSAPWTTTAIFSSITKDL
jgi:hypothetical protein